MIFFFRIIYAFRFEDHEDLALVKMKAMIGWDFKFNHVKYFNVPTSNAFFYKIIFREQSVGFYKYDPLSKKKDMSLIKEFKKQGDLVVEPILEHIQNLIVSLPQSLESFCLTLYDERQPNLSLEKLRLLLDQRIKQLVTKERFKNLKNCWTPVDYHKTYADRDCLTQRNQWIYSFKLPVNEFVREKDEDVIFCRINLFFGEEKVKKALKSVRHKFAFSNVRKYVSGSARRSYGNDYVRVNEEFYKVIPADYKCLQTKEELKQIFISNAKNWILCYPDYSEESIFSLQKTFIDLSDDEIIGLVVLLFQVCNDEVAHESIIVELLEDNEKLFSNTFVATFIEKLSNNVFYRMVSAEVNSLRFFLAIFLIKCREYFAIEIRPIIRQMAEDYKNRCVPECFIDKEDSNDIARNAFFLASDFFQIIPCPNSSKTNENIKWFSQQYNIPTDVATAYLTRKLSYVYLHSILEGRCLILVE